jgi:hypothetical protein
MGNARALFLLRSRTFQGYKNKKGQSMKRLSIMAAIAVASLSGCAAWAPCTTCPTTPIAVSPQSIRLTAVGYGATSNFEGYTAGQKRLMAMRASKVDAYRAIAEQIYGVRIKGQTTVSAMVAQSDSFRSYVDAYVRGARVLSVTPMADGNYETELELDLPVNFMDRYSGWTNAGCGTLTGYVGPSCSFRYSQAGTQYVD